MSVRSLRRALHYVMVILGTLIATQLYQRYKEEKHPGSETVGLSSVIQLCELPALPAGLVPRYLVIDDSDNPELVDILMTLTGPAEILDPWLEKVDLWEKDRPGQILNHKIRESEYTSRVDFSAEVYRD